MGKHNKYKYGTLRSRIERQKRLASQFDSLTSEEKLRYISYPSKFSEFEIQSFLYEGLKLRGYNVCGEVKTRCGSCRFDIVIFDYGNKPLKIIEVKKHIEPKLCKFEKRAAKHNRKIQLRKYRRFGLEVDVVSSMKEAVSYLDKIRMELVRLSIT